MKKLRLLTTAVLSALCLGAFAQTSLDLGRDWDPTNSVLIDPISGVDFEPDVLTYTIGTGEVAFTIGGGATAVAKSNRNVYANPVDPTISNADLKEDQTHFFEGNVINTKLIKGIKLNGTGSKLIADGIVPKPALLYSDKTPFDENSIIGYEAFELPACRAGTTGVEFAANIPAGTKSFRVYRKATLSASGSVFVLNADGEVIPAEGGDNVRIAYAKVTFEDDPNATPEPSLVLTSAESTTNQTVLTDVAIAPITYSFGGSATSASVSWDNTPNGIAAATDGNVVTISGSTATAGTYTYSVTATDGTNTTAPLTGTITVNAVSGGKTLIAYVTSVSPATDGSDIQIINKLSETYEVVTVAIASGVDYSAYKAIVLASLPNSSAVGMTALKTIDKPFVNIKPYMFQASRWNWGVPANIEVESAEEIVNKVAVSEASHDVFAGLSLNSGDVVALASGSKHGKFRTLTPITSWIGSNESNVTVLAAVTGSAANDGQVVIGEIIKGSVMDDAGVGDIPVAGGTEIKHRNIFFGVSEQAEGYLTAEFLTMINNAVTYVIAGGNSIDSDKMDNAGKVEVAAEYYDLMGRAISGTPKGIVIKKSIYEDGSVSFGKAYIK